MFDRDRGGSARGEGKNAIITATKSHAKILHRYKFRPQSLENYYGLWKFFCLISNGKGKLFHLLLPRRLFYYYYFFPSSLSPCVFGRLGLVNNVFPAESQRRLGACQPPGKRARRKTLSIYYYVLSLYSERREREREQFEQSVCVCVPAIPWLGPRFVFLRGSSIYQELFD